MMEFQIKKLEDFKVEEKIKFFDEMYKMASDEMKEHEAGDYVDESDAEYYAWEKMMTILAGDDHRGFWNYFNSME